MKDNKALKLYVTIGKVLCGIAGGIVGFLIAGPLLVVPGIILGIMSGYLFKKSLLSNVS